MYDALDPADCFPGASEVALAAAEAAMGTHLPDEYRAFLAFSDGFNGEIGGHFLMLWSTAELPSLATGYDVLPAGPDQLLIGSNGGPTAFAIIKGRYASVPFDSGLADMRILADGFESFLAAIAAGEGW